MDIYQVKSTVICFTKLKFGVLRLLLSLTGFVMIPAGVGLLSPCNRVFQAKPAYVYLHKNKRVLHALQGCRTLLRESTLESTRCRELTSGWPDFVGIVDASSHGVGGGSVRRALCLHALGVSMAVARRHPYAINIQRERQGHHH